MTTVTEALHQAYTGEAKAALRLKLYAEIAEKEGLPQIAKLFSVIAFSEEIHGKRALKLLREAKSTEENLKASFESEQAVAGVSYGNFIKAAEAEGNKAAALHFSQSRDVEEVHARLYKEAMNHLMEERETTYYVCTICGYVSDGILPDECPVCQAKRDLFVKFA
jgi:rubrerythrin